MNISLFDLGILLILFLFLLRGLLRGLVKEVAGLVGISLGFFIASRFYIHIMPLVEPYIQEKQWQAIASYGIIIVTVMICVAIFSILLQKFMELTFTSWINHVAGGLAGLMKGVLICGIILTILHVINPDGQLTEGSQLSKYIDQIMDFTKKILPPLDRWK